MRISSAVRRLLLVTLTLAGLIWSSLPAEAAYECSDIAGCTYCFFYSSDGKPTGYIRKCPQ